MPEEGAEDLPIFVFFGHFILREGALCRSPDLADRLPSRCPWWWHLLRRSVVVVVGGGGRRRRFVVGESLRSLRR